MLWTSEFYTGYKWSDTSKTKLMGGQANATGHWSLEEQRHFFPALLLHCSLCSHLWTRKWTVRAMNFSLTIKEKKNCKCSIQFLNEGGKAKVQLLAGLWEGIWPLRNSPEKCPASLGQWPDWLDWNPLLGLWFSSRKRFFTKTFKKNISFPSV